MKKLLRLAERFPIFKLLLPVYALLAVGFAVLIRRGDMQLLNPAGYIADVQSKLLWGVVVFAAVVGSIMIGGFFFVVFHYREGKRATYTPEWSAGPLLQSVGWGSLMVVIALISVVLWVTAHDVDPYRPIASDKAPLNIQVVALRWKWLFIYPDQRVATVNNLEIPVNTPVAFHLTADAPMNSFWIPRLSGQIYAMTGMVTQLHIEADKVGTYAGGPAEISGDEFAGMEFTVHAVSSSDYAAWAAAAQSAPQSLDYDTYNQLAKPSSYNPSALYALHDKNLFDVIVMKFMMPTGEGNV